MNLTKRDNTTKYLAIKELSDENKTYSISALCEFAGIARLAYYKWLGHVNSDNDNLNAVQSNEVFEMADEQGISKRTLENAKKELGIRAKKINNSWYWELDKVKSD